VKLLVRDEVAGVTVERLTDQPRLWPFQGGRVRAKRHSYDVLRIPDALTGQECAKVLQLATVLPVEYGVTEEPLAGTRRNLVRWILPKSHTNWVFELVEVLFARAQNELGFEIDGLNEPLQLATYAEHDHFDWHWDLVADPVFERKLSLTIQLSAPGEYDGGDLEFFPHGAMSDCRPQGTAIVFPSFLQYRVREVMRGVRHSLVAWAGGRPLR
jgi:PKHD-type hydroxylase